MSKPKPAPAPQTLSRQKVLDFAAQQIVVLKERARIGREFPTLYQAFKKQNELADRTVRCAAQLWKISDDEILARVDEMENIALAALEQVRQSLAARKAGSTEPTEPERTH